ncbi:hypothetical protein KKG61_00555 [bacterium]|nr:hypothetical protein [bacterium]
MWQDPIVQDVRKAGEELAKQANYDLHTFFKNLRNNEKKRNSKVVAKLEDEIQNLLLWQELKAER